MVETRYLDDESSAEPSRVHSTRYHPTATMLYPDDDSHSPLTTYAFVKSVRGGAEPVTFNPADDGVVV